MGEAFTSPVKGRGDNLKAALPRMLEKHEGRRNKLYLDSEGLLTIGVGHLIDPKAGGSLPDEIVDALFAYDLRVSLEDLTYQLPWTKGLDDVRFAVLADMCFNLGITKLLGFVRTLRYVQAGQYADASIEMLDSRWARQVKTRAFRLSKMMETGEWPEGV